MRQLQLTRLVLNHMWRASRDFSKAPLRCRRSQSRSRANGDPGKSSFMLQLKNRLCATEKNRVAVEFNAWRHDKNDSLWAAFALECAQDLRSSLLFRDRIRGWVHLNRARLDGYKGWAHLLRLGVVTILWLCLLMAGPTLLILKGRAWTDQTLMSLQTPPKASQPANPTSIQASSTTPHPDPDSSHPINRLVLLLIIRRRSGRRLSV